MPILKQYQLFISHSWKNKEYDNLIGLLNEARYFHSLNYSEIPLNAEFKINIDD